MTSHPTSWQRDGYLLMPGALDRSAVSGLREASEHALAQWRATSNPDNQPGQFWAGPDGWILIHLNHPRYFMGRHDWLVRILDAVAAPPAIDAITKIMGEPPVFMQCNLYIDPPVRGHSNGGHWHRDCQFYAGGDEAVEKRLFHGEADPPRELHMHIPLVPTQATGVVPGSHIRWDTPEEYEVRRRNPSAAMPGGIRLPMQPGDIGLFHVNSIHRGYYNVGVPRRTIAITFGSRAKYRPFDPVWWKNMRGYVATFQPWTRRPGYLDGVTPPARELFQRFIDTYGDQWRAENLNPDAIGPARMEYFRLD